MVANASTRAALKVPLAQAAQARSDDAPGAAVSYSPTLHMAMAWHTRSDELGGTVGANVGAAVGAVVGAVVGAAVGAAVTSVHACGDVLLSQ